jgi:hypothetical protein
LLSLEVVGFRFCDDIGQKRRSVWYASGERVVGKSSEEVERCLLDWVDLRWHQSEE